MFDGASPLRTRYCAGQALSAGAHTHARPQKEPLRACSTSHSREFCRASTPHRTCHCHNLLIVVSPAHMQTQIFAEHAILGLHALSLSS